jgi:hypothetical protein
MSDGVTLPGTGATVDTETQPTGRGQMQRVKIALGAIDADMGDITGILLNADGMAVSGSAYVQEVGAVLLGFNGTTFDRVQSTSKALNVYLAGQIAGEDLTDNVMRVEEQYSYQYISTATTTTIKTGAGMFRGIIVGGGTAGTIIIYDNTAGSGTIIQSFDSTNAIASYMFSCKFATGLTIVTGAATKITVIYR